jgi:probable RNA-binding protein EIF1AD
MSGSKRGSAYRKSVVSSYENDYPEPNSENGEVVCRIVGSRGAHVFEIIAPDSDQIQLVVLPRKYQNLIWVKRNDFVIIEKGTEEVVESKDSKEANSQNQTIMFLIKHILGKDQINHIRKAGMWPGKFDDVSGKGRGGGYADDMEMVYSSEPTEEEYEDVDEEAEVADATA